MQRMGEAREAGSRPARQLHIGRWRPSTTLPVMPTLSCPRSPVGIADKAVANTTTARLTADPRWAFWQSVSGALAAPHARAYCDFWRRSPLGRALVPNDED